MTSNNFSEPKERMSQSDWDARQRFFLLWYNRKLNIDACSRYSDYQNWIREIHGLITDVSFLLPAKYGACIGEFRKKLAFINTMRERYSGEAFRNICRVRMDELEDDLRTVEADVQDKMWKAKLLIPYREVVEEDDPDAIARLYAQRT